MYLLTLALNLLRMSYIKPNMKIGMTYDVYYVELIFQFICLIDANGRSKGICDDQMLVQRCHQKTEQLFYIFNNVIMYELFIIQFFKYQ